MNRRWMCMLAIPALLLGACSRQKPLVQRIPVVGHKSPKAVLQAVTDSSFEYSTLKFRASTEVTVDDKTQSFKTYVRMKRDSIIWLSVQVVNVEGARLVITPDSVKFLNRRDNNYFVGGYDYLDSLFQINVDFETVQGLLTGTMSGMRYIDKDEKKEFRQDQKEEKKEYREERKEEKKEYREDRKEAREQGERLERNRKDRDKWEKDKLDRMRVSVDKGFYLVSDVRKRKLRKAGELGADKIGEDIVHSGWYDMETFRLMRMSINDLNTHQMLMANFGELTAFDNQLFPTLLQFTVTTDKVVETEMRYSKVKVDSPLKFPFRVPDKYEPIKGSGNADLPDSGAQGPRE